MTNILSLSSLLAGRESTSALFSAEENRTDTVWAGQKKWYIRRLDFAQLALKISISVTENSTYGKRLLLSKKQENKANFCFN